MRFTGLLGWDDIDGAMGWMEWWGDGVMSDGVMGDGVMGDGVMSDGVMSDGVMSDGVMSDGVMGWWGDVVEGE
jgi:hypothetical protein